MAIRLPKPKKAPSLPPIEPSFDNVHQVDEMQADEIIETIERTLTAQRIDPISMQRFVITGGSSQLQGMREVMQSHFNRTVRVATPQGLQGIGDVVHTPTFSLCAGLLHYAMRDYQGLQMHTVLEKPKSIIWRTWNWIRQHV